MDTMDIFYDTSGKIEHKCHAFKTHACSAAIEDFVTGMVVCRYSGRQWGFVSHETFHETFHEEEKEEEEEPTEQVDSVHIQSIIRQLINNSTFPLEAYTLELVRIYEKYQGTKYFHTLEEYVVSTLYLMAGGYDDVCAPNKFLNTVLPIESELKNAKINKTIITSGNRNWQRLYKEEEKKNGVQQQRTHLFSFKKAKTTTNTIVIHTHEEIINTYRKKWKQENRFFIDL